MEALEAPICQKPQVERSGAWGYQGCSYGRFVEAYRGKELARAIPSNASSKLTAIVRAHPRLRYAPPEVSAQPRPSGAPHQAVLWPLPFSP